ncbi:hypothetical protein LX36DRAFT_336590 [Colletotrichum falcatum]|nr:hypothetical protein LX36DRAFT_336590 [Colletotrichum falcatum]
MRPPRHVVSTFTAHTWHLAAASTAIVAESFFFPLSPRPKLVLHVRVDTARPLSSLVYTTYESLSLTLWRVHYFPNDKGRGQDETLIIGSGTYGH